MKEYLFVYGTLMANIKTGIANKLHEHSRFLGDGWIKGKLYDLGHYPGLIPDLNSESTVFGHVFELFHPLKTIKILDEYENVGQRFGIENEYRRERINITLENRIVECWAYIYNLSPNNLPVITSGNYLEYLTQNRQYLDFLKSL
ncbi:MAG: gamma-glutamylcyclotransferase [Bacteroidetes bacterium]|jgi:gamma-glutamylcyclotransferase (GGCT)/AIG2-like uncharacterized protein YtfP|nr:gamma-glutamylcyclotransferase [Bacteroidota bacterium]MDF1867182.1 gamma-glutamylcyclotransferase [Saprospiraceae bacterium]